MNFRYQKNIQIWSELAQSDPFWAVLSHPDKRGGKWDEAEFYETGKKDWEQVKDRLAELNSKIEFGSALDFGCGVGRLSMALARDFKSVTGVDAAPGMLALGQKTALQNALGNIRWVVNETDRLNFIQDSSQDFVLCLLCLQHIPPYQAKALLVEFLRVLKPGGMLVFNIPIGRKDYWLMRFKKLIKELLGLKDEIPYEMNFIPRSELEKLIQVSGGSILAADPENLAPKFEAKRFIVAKK